MQAEWYFSKAGTDDAVLAATIVKIIVCSCRYNPPVPELREPNGGMGPH